MSHDGLGIRIILETSIIVSNSDLGLASGRILANGSLRTELEENQFRASFNSCERGES